MVHEALQQWRKKNFSGLAGDPALSRFLTQNMASREGTPKTGKGMAVDSPFSLASLSPLSPLIACDDSVLLEACMGDLTQLVDAHLPLEIPVREDSTTTSDEENKGPSKDEEWTASPRRSLRRKTKRIDNVTSTRSSRKNTRKNKRTTTPKNIKKKLTVDDVFVAVPQGESRKCSCKKSKCLKLYCECFAAGVLCDPGCKCTDCSNTADNVAARRKAVAYKLSRKPRAFQEKIVETKSAKDGAVHSKGCNCKRSGCQKKYCECYQGGVACSDACKCVGCKNDGGLMHLRDLGVAGWKAPDGGFRQSAHGLMSTMIVVPAGRFLEEPIPPCETEVALERYLLAEHLKREARQSVMKAKLASEIEGSCPVWPVAKPAQVTLAQVTPRSGTALEPYPDNTKRRCNKKTPKSFAVSAKPDEDTDGWLVELGDASSVLSPVAEDGSPLSACDGNQLQDDALSLGVNMGGIQVDQAIVDRVVATLEGSCNEVAAQRTAGGTSSRISTSETLLEVVQNVDLLQVDEIMQLEGAMADLLTPRLTDLLTPRLADMTPRSCRSDATRSSILDGDTFDWDQLVSTPRAMAVC